MAARRCAARTCFNVQGCRPNLKFFKFPDDDEECCDWASRCGRADLLEKPLPQLKKFLLCSDHFEDCWFLNPKYKTSFKRNARPSPTIFRNNLANFVPKSLKKSCEFLNHNLLETVDQCGIYTDELTPEQTCENVRPLDEMLEVFRRSSHAVDEGGETRLAIDNIEVADYQQLNVEHLDVIRGCHKMCRLCACLVYEDQLTSLFMQQSMHLIDKINQFLPEKVTENDGLPHEVCTFCVRKLEDCCRVLDMFLAADRKLRAVFHLLATPYATEIPVKFHKDGECLNKLPESPSKLESPLKPVSNVSSEDVSTEHLRDPPTHQYQNIKMNGDNFKEVKMELPENLTDEEAEHYTLKCEMDVPNALPELMEVTPTIVEEDDVGTYLASGTAKNSESTGKVYHCGMCHSAFSEKSRLLIHEISEHVAVGSKHEPSIPVPRKYKQDMPCKDCGLIFKGKKSLRTHVRECHIPQDNICQYCGARYKNKNQFELHLRLHTNEKPHQCDECNMNFSFQTELKKHKRQHIKPASRECSACGKVFPSRTALWRHEQTHLDSRRTLCYLCGKVLSNKQSLRVHMRTHSSDRPYSCPTCSKSFKTSAAVSKHKLVHSSERKFRCEICGRAFYSMGLLKQHKLSHLGVKPHKCSVCGAAFNRLGNLNQHKKKHGKDSECMVIPFECHVCGKGMRSALTLKYHLGKHTGEKKPFDCEQCGKRFIALDPYRVHMRMHTGERPFNCQVCAKTFRSIFTLKQHQRLHRDEFPYSCPYCERKFKRLQSLIVHKRTHTGEKPHKCPMCGRCFAQKGDMLKHTKTHLRSKGGEEPIILQLESFPTELILGDTEIPSEFLMDMPIVEVETELQ